MKKFFGVFTLCFCMLLCGTVLSACCGHSETFKIAVDVDASLASVKILVDNQEVAKEEDGTTKVAKNSKVRFEVYSTVFGVDFSSAQVLVDGAAMQLKGGDDYQALNAEDVKFAGYFLVAPILKDTNISVSGMKKLQSSITFKTENEADLQDESVQEKLQITSVSFDGENYVNLHQLMQSPNPTLVADFANLSDTENTISKLKVKFDANNIFNPYNGAVLSLVMPDQQVKILYDWVLNEEIYEISFGKVGREQNYTLSLNFKALEYLPYTFSFPEENLTYSVSTSSQEISYEQEGTLMLAKDLDASLANYSSARVLLDGVELEKVDETEQNVVYKIGKHTRPAQGNVLDVKVLGITYQRPVQKITAFTIGQDFVITGFLQHSLFIVDEHGNKMGNFGFDEEGTQLALRDQKVALSWQIVENAQGYNFPYDIYEYDILINKEKAINLKEMLSAATNNFENLQDVVFTDNGYTLRAIFDEKTNCFDTFQLEFACQEDSNLTVEGFVAAVKKVVVSHSLEGINLTKAVEFAIANNYEEIDPSQWRVLTEASEESVFAGQLVLFKLFVSATDSLDTSKFTIEDAVVFRELQFVKETVVGEDKECVFAFVVSDINWLNEVKEFKLVSIHE